DEAHRDERDQDDRHASQRVGLVLQAEALAGDGDVEDDAEPQRLDEADRGDREEDATQAQHRQADQQPDDSGQQYSNRDVEDDGRVPVQLHQDRRVRADGHEPRRGERQLARVEDEEHRRGHDAVDPDLRDEQRVRVPEPDRVAQELDEEVHRLDSLSEARAEQALRTQHQHQEQGGERDASAGVTAERDQGEDLDQAEQVASDHRAGDAAHAAEDDHRQAAHLNVVAPDVRAYVAQRQPEEDAGQPSERG